MFIALVFAVPSLASVHGLDSEARFLRGGLAKSIVCSGRPAVAPRKHFRIRLEAIASRLEAIASRLEAITSRLA